MLVGGIFFITTGQHLYKGLNRNNYQQNMAKTSTWEESLTNSPASSLVNLYVSLYEMSKHKQTEDDMLKIKEELEIVSSILRNRSFNERLQSYRKILQSEKETAKREDFEYASKIRDMRQDFLAKILD